jgi:hypothetical protein
MDGSCGRSTRTTRLRTAAVGSPAGGGFLSGSTTCSLPDEGGWASTVGRQHTASSVGAAILVPYCRRRATVADRRRRGPAGMRREHKAEAQSRTGRSLDGSPLQLPAVLGLDSAVEEPLLHDGLTDSIHLARTIQLRGGCLNANPYRRARHSGGRHRRNVSPTGIGGLTLGGGQGHPMWLDSRANAGWTSKTMTIARARGATYARVALCASSLCAVPRSWARR